MLLHIFFTSEHTTATLL